MGKESLFFMLTHNLIIVFLESKGIHSWSIIFIFTLLILLLLYFPLSLLIKQSTAFVQSVTNYYQEH